MASPFPPPLRAVPEVKAPKKKPGTKPERSMSGSGTWTLDVRIGFPYYYHAGFLAWKKLPLGWEDLGEVAWTDEIENGKGIKTQPIHDVCQDALRVGKQEKFFFRFCKRCLVKVKFV